MQSFSSASWPNPEIEAGLRRSDPYWSQVPKVWDESVFLGNGMMGCTIYCAEHKSMRQALRYVMGRVDVTCRREGLYAARIPIGDFELSFGSWIYGGTKATLSLWDAQMDMDVVTVEGTGRVESFMHHERDVLVVRASAQGDTLAARLVPYPEVSAAVLVDDGRPNIDQYMPEFETEHGCLDGVCILRQQYNGGEDGCVMAYAQAGDVFYITVQNGHGEESVQRAVSTVQAAAGLGFEALQAEHRRWWHAYWQKSFVSLPDPMVEGFYHVQIYKLASATRADAPVLDNQGPWTGPTPWPGTWYNMNVQLAYSPVYIANHLEEGKSLTDSLARNMQHLIGNVPPDWREDSAAIGRSMSHDMVSQVDDEIGNLPWVCHNVWRQYRYSMDARLRDALLYPLLRRSMGYYLHLLSEGEDGRLHLPATISPEYGSFRKLKVEDSNYDLFLLRWGLEALIALNRERSTTDPDEGRWRSVLENLADYPIDETGFMIGRGVPMTHGHRHYSHLMGYWPLYLLDLQDEKWRALLETSLAHWFSLEGDLRGFTFAGAAAMAAALGDGDKALAFLKGGLGLIKPNTFYREAGPVIESPLGMAEALQTMLIDSHGGLVRVFPAVPEAWEDAFFHSLRAEGAFLVTARQAGGKTAYIRVTSEAGAALRVQTGWTGAIHAEYEDGRTGSISPDTDGGYTVPLAAGESVLLSPKALDKPIDVMPVACIPGLESLEHYWGSPKAWRNYGIPYQRSI